MTPRVAYFTDCFHEANGVALTSRQFDHFARQRGLPFLNIHGGPENNSGSCKSVTAVELDASRLSVPLDSDFRFDLLFLRWLEPIRQAMREFRPDVVHVTSMGNFGLLGAMMANEMDVPLVASWHTNVHEFGARRLESLLWFLPRRMRRLLGHKAQSQTLRMALRFYQLAQVVFAPNRDLVRLLEKGVRKPVYLMWRGVDVDLFNPMRRAPVDDDLVLGFVGRIQPEKNVRFLAEVERRLRAEGITKYRFVVIGQGDERTWLAENLMRAEFPGVLSGESLARAYANMDVFVFPSRTDTFGNVVQEAQASGVPAVVTHRGGPKYLVQHGETGYVARGDGDFLDCVARLAKNAALRRRMGRAARRTMLDRSWDKVFEGVYQGYRRCWRAS